jgi:subtilisin family serine protease
MKCATAAVAFASLMLLNPAPALAQSAQKQFAGITSTTTGYRTWDMDMINLEAVSQTGRGVYVAVLDTGLVPNWRDYFPEARVATEWGAGFVQPVNFKAGNLPCGFAVELGRLRRTTWVGSRGSTHGTHVASTIVGYFYQAPADAAAGFPLPPIIVRGIAPEVTIIPVRVLADYQIPAMPECGVAAQVAVFGTDSMIAAGLNYVTDLAIAGLRPMVVNMSLGGPALEAIEKAALDRAIANGVIVVAAAGNEGEFGMSFPGAYPPVISAGSAGWIGEWTRPNVFYSFYRMWWLQYPNPPILPGSGDVADPTTVNDVYVSDFSSRELAGQELDVLAPGSWVRGPFPGTPGYNHLPWWSNGQGAFRAVAPLANFFYVGGTSMATPHVASLAAMMLQKNPTLTQAQIESILKATALAMPAVGSRQVFDPFVPPPQGPIVTITWDTFCEPPAQACDAVGSGLIRADAALAATP